jgi:CIC family chloride channel protein
LVDVAGGGHGSPGGYVLVGMASMIAATTHAPITAAVLAFELSGDYGIVLPLLLATGGATVVARALRARSIYQ